ncbi:hypothetical protein YC2023_117750 [Brassica napus]
MFLCPHRVRTDRPMSATSTSKRRLLFCTELITLNVHTSKKVHTHKGILSFIKGFFAQPAPNHVILG